MSDAPNPLLPTSGTPTQFSPGGFPIPGPQPRMVAPPKPVVKIGNIYFNAPQIAFVNCTVTADKTSDGKPLTALASIWVAGKETPVTIINEDAQAFIDWYDQFATDATPTPSV